MVHQLALRGLQSMSKIYHSIIVNSKRAHSLRSGEVPFADIPIWVSASGSLERDLRLPYT